MIFPEISYLCGVFPFGMRRMRKRTLLTLCLATVLVPAACNRDNATLGALPRIVCDYLEREGDHTAPCSPERADSLYAVLAPAFASLQGREVPFTQPASEVGYRVLGVRIEALRHSCDLTVGIRLQLTQAKTGSVRVCYLVAGKEGETLSRGIAVIPASQPSEQQAPAGTMLEGSTNLRLVAHAAAYRNFGMLVFLSRAEFEAAGDRLQERQGR